jgi:UDP-2,3-diacylglucosamine pyrophosphatase LpxH
MLSEAVYFISDAHLGVENRQREAMREDRLHDFLNSLSGCASTLVIVGDLFAPPSRGATSPRSPSSNACANRA